VASAKAQGARFSDELIKALILGLAPDITMDTVPVSTSGKAHPPKRYSVSLKRTTLTKGAAKRILFRGGVARCRTKVVEEVFPEKAREFLERVVPCIIEMTHLKKRKTVRPADVTRTLQDLGLKVMLGAD